MSVVKTSDVHLFETGGGTVDNPAILCCRDCHLVGQLNYHLYRYSDAVIHLLKHRSAGHAVPLFNLHQLLWAMERYGDVVIREDQVSVASLFSGKS